MKKITLIVSDDQSADLINLLINEVSELRVKNLGPDQPVSLLESSLAAREADTPPPAPKIVEVPRKLHRGDKTARDIILELLDVEPVRSRGTIQEHLVKCGFAEHTAYATISKMVADGLIIRLGKEAIQLIPEEERQQQQQQQQLQDA